MGNAIGRGNRHLFLVFLWLELGAVLVSTILAVVRIHAGVSGAGGGPAVRPAAHWNARGIGMEHVRARAAHPPAARVPATLPPPLLLTPRACSSACSPPIHRLSPPRPPLARAPQGGGGGPHLSMVGPVAFVVFDLFLLISVAALAIAQASQVARNVTTNELANWHRWAGA